MAGSAGSGGRTPKPPQTSSRGHDPGGTNPQTPARGHDPAGTNPQTPARGHDPGERPPVWQRQTARVLPVNPEGRVLLLHGWDPHRPEQPFWFTIGGAAEAGESLRDAAARELREEVGISVDPALLGEPIARSTIEFSWAGHRISQDQTFYAILLESARVSLDGLDTWERATTDKYGWLSADDLDGAEHPAHPEIPGLIRAAAASVRARPR